MAPRRLVPSILVLGLAAGLVATGSGTGAVHADDPYECDVPTAADPIDVSFVGRYDTGLTDGQQSAGTTAAEIVAYENDMLYVMNAGAIDIVDVSNPAAPVKVGASIVLPNDPTSVAVSQGLVAVSVPAAVKTDAGKVMFFRGSTPVGVVTVGALPDMVTFTPNGRLLLVANEGEPSGYGAGFTDPEGSISIIPTQDFRKGTATKTMPTVLATAVSFADFNVGGARAAELAAGVRIVGPGATVAQDLEPEYISISENGKTAWVSLQENNSLAEIDIPGARVTRISPLGYSDHSRPGFGIDASDADGVVNIRNWPVQGVYMPDGIAYARLAGQQYVLTANEGDARDWPGITGAGSVEEVRRARAVADGTVFPEAARPSGSTPTNAELDAQLGRLRVTPLAPATVGSNGKLTSLYSFGSRSFSIRTAAGDLVWDSGDDLECITSVDARVRFNASNDNDTFDNRSDDKGPEPESVAVGKIEDRTFAFIALERTGGVVIYDISDPTAPMFHTYLVSREFDGGLPSPDSGPEGLDFIPADQSPTGLPMLAVGNETTGTAILWTIGTAILWTIGA